MANKDEMSLPVDNNNTEKSHNFLPKYFRSDANKKFLSSTVDQFITPGKLEKINSYAGRRHSLSREKTDLYLKDVTSDRENYQFEPSLVQKDEYENVNFYKDYNDYLGVIKKFGGNVSNHSKLNASEFYAWNPHIDLDKFVNFREYYWLSNGPRSVAISGQQRETVSTYKITNKLDSNSTVFVVTPNGIKYNPTLKLYKGQTYKFDINSPGYPVAIATNRSYIDQDYSAEINTQNTSNLYTTGIKKYIYKDDGSLELTTQNYIENGIIELKVSDTIPDTLFYISESDGDVSGILNFFNISENSQIDIDNEIIGKSTYTLGTGTKLSNGMKIHFEGNVIPTKYSTGSWYVEGVGDSISLIPEIELVTSNAFSSDKSSPFDNSVFDEDPLDVAITQPITRDYILINRNSPDRNPWSRNNRWFHKSVIESSLLANNLPIDIDESTRAIRPIIEFESGLKLFNHGAKAKAQVDLVDTYTKDVFSTIEGSIGYNVDGVDLAHGMRVLFTADTDILVSGKIYKVRVHTHNLVKQISLVEEADASPLDNDVVLSKLGNSYKGKMFFYNGKNWKLAQEKTAINQEPLFDLFDKLQNNLNDEILYDSSNFAGNKVFSYKIGTGVADTELGFPLSYNSINNIGDIAFNFDLLTQSVIYQTASLTEVTYKTDKAFLKKYNTDGTTFEYTSGWKKANVDSYQHVIQTLQVSTILNNFDIDVYDNSSQLTDLTVQVLVNGIRKIENVDYTVDNTSNFRRIVFIKNLKTEDLVVFKCLSSADKNTNGFYEMPINFEKNPLNENITSFTLGEVLDHVDSIAEAHPSFDGVHPGSNNLRDIGNLAKYGRRFVKHSGPVNLALYHLASDDSNVINSLRYAKTEYAKFKRKLIFEIENSGFHGSTKEHADLVLSNLSKDFISSNAFKFMDMIGFENEIKTRHTITSTGVSYFSLSSTFTLDTLSSKSVLVYKNDQQLLHDKDYTFKDGFVNLLTTPLINDVIDIYEYDSTDSWFVPPTPTKLGLYPKYQPIKYIDTTYNFNTPVSVIQGHDGSLIKAFDDYRDDIILEIEYRIFNNIKAKYDVNKLDIHDFIKGKFRSSGFTSTKINKILISDFVSWNETVGNLTYSENNDFLDTDSFSYNYSYLGSYNNEVLSGSWRSIYKDYFDTDRPHSHPWEMLGFYIKPTWWDTVYGVAPYTKDNLILWQDLSQGIIRQPGVAIIKNKKYVRLDLLNYIPVDSSGNLLSPYDSGLAQNFNVSTANQSWMFGDYSPVETAWRRSSEYPFALLTAWVLSQPAKVLGLGFDTSRVNRDLSNNLVYSSTEKQIELSQLLFPTFDNVQTINYSSGLINYISAFLIGKNLDVYNLYKDTLTKLTNQLSIKLGGYADKSKLKLVLDSRSPLNKNTVFVPDENYQIFFNTSSVIDLVSISAIIVEKSNKGYLISGYNKTTPFFDIYKSIRQVGDIQLTVGGVSEEFILWSQESQYVSGIVVQYNDEYYRTTITHESTQTFDDKKFTKLSKLPLAGGTTALIATHFEDTLTRYNYGHLIETDQELVDFLLGYEQYLQQQGFIFDYFNNETQLVEDVNLLIKEFLFWTQQNWDNGTVLSLSPFANAVVFERKYHVVDNLKDSKNNDYVLLSNDGTVVTNNTISVYRDEKNMFGIQPLDDKHLIYSVNLPLVQREHIVLIDNSTVFNDTIYQTSTGYRQDRIKLVGHRTADWNGSYNIPGFIFDDPKISDWQVWSDYTIGDVVRYKQYYYSSNTTHSSTEKFNPVFWTLLDQKPTRQLLPNWDYKALQFTEFYDLDSDNFDSEQQRMAQHLIGYQPREYLSNIIADSSSEYKFYQGFIQEKGTKNSLTKLFDKLSTADKDSLEFYEEWALRVGNFGSFDNIEELEFKLDESKIKLEPQIFELTDNTTSRNDLVYELTNNSLQLTPDGYNNNPFVEKFDNNFFTRYSGFVNDNDVSFIVTFKDNILDLNLNAISAGEFIWVTHELTSWNVYRIIHADELTINSFALNLPEESRIDQQGNFVQGFTCYFNGYVNLSVNDIIGIRSDSIVTGFYKVNSVLAKDGLTEVGLLTSQAINEEDQFPTLSSTTVLKLVTRKFADVNIANSTAIDLYNTPGDRIWLENNGNSLWEVYQNQSMFKLHNEVINPVELDSTTDEFGTSISSNKLNNIVTIGSPTHNNIGRIGIFTRNTEFENLIQSQALIPVDSLHSTSSNYGFSTSITSTDRFIAVGAPLATNVKSKLVGTLSSSGNYSAGDIVLDRGILWEARRTITGDNSTITDQSHDWKVVSMLTADKDGTSSGLSNQGLVYLYEKNYQTGAYGFHSCVISPTPTTDEKFGYHVEIRKTVGEETYRLFVGAPGADRIYFIDYDGSTWNYSIDRKFKGEYSNSVQYNNLDIVLYNEELYQASITMTAGSNLPTITAAWTKISDPTLSTVSLIEHTGYVPRTGMNIADEADDSSADSIVNIGKIFDVNELGDVLAFKSSDGFDNKISVYFNQLGRWKYIQDISSANTHEQFGYCLAVNDTGDKIAIGAPGNDETGIDQGCVYVYKKTTINNVSTYSLDQTLKSIHLEINEFFGTSLDFSKNKLAVSAKNTDRRLSISFDTYDEFIQKYIVDQLADHTLVYSKYVLDSLGTKNDSITTFDSNSTTFKNVTKDTGRIFIFQDIGNNFIFAEDVDYQRKTTGSELENFVFSNNHIYIGLPNVDPADTSDSTIVNLTTADSVGIVTDLRADINIDSWTSLSVQDGMINLDKIKRVLLYSADTDDLLTTLDVVDCRQGRIPRVADVEISYKTFYDPAIYSVNTQDELGNIVANVVVDESSAWNEEYEGRLWWNLSTSAWYDPYQGDSHYRSAHRSKLIFGTSIDIYEWVGTSLTPSQWLSLSNTNEGISDGVSGVPLYGDQAYSIKRVFDSVSKTFSEKYFYWVKNKKTIPSVNFRTLDAMSVANIIADPASQGYRYVEILDTNKFILHNCKSFIEGTNSILRFELLKDENLQVNLHREYQLLAEGVVSREKLNHEIEQKWLDSLVGYDLQEIQLPDLSLPVSNRYGILNYPRQGMFINNKEALKQVIERANSILYKYQIVDNYDISGLLTFDKIPNADTGVYDSIVETIEDLDNIIMAKFEKAELLPVISNGKIIRVNIIKSGRSYVNAPVIKITSSSGIGAVLQSTINNLGQITSVTVRDSGKKYSSNTTLTVRDYTALVKTDSTVENVWTIYKYNKITRIWERTNIQSYDTRQYWIYKDWYADGYDKLTTINKSVDQSYQLFLLDCEIGDIVKIKTIGTGGWLLLKKINDTDTEDYTVNYQTIGRENGTIELSTSLYDTITSSKGYDSKLYDTSFYDKEPVEELRIIMSVLKNNIFIADLEVEYYNLFFASLRYAFAEQPGLDWAFKSSFVTAKHNLGNFKKTRNYQNDNLENYQDYVNEVKPFKTKVREYISSYENISNTQTMTSDFDLPPSYHDGLIETSSAVYNKTTDLISNLDTRYNNYPYKNWKDNVGFDIASIKVINGGSGYIDTPVVKIGDSDIIAYAYLKNSSVDSIQIISQPNTLKFLTAPTITIGTSKDGVTASAIAILGKSVVRSSHMIMKFDRVRGSYYVTDLVINESFTGTGSKETFGLKWPIDIKTNQFSITINSKILVSSNYTVGNKLDTTKGYDRYLGYVTFNTAPLATDTIVITYKKDIRMLDAADRINFFYTPTSNMPGKDLSQLLNGVKNAKSVYEGTDFGVEQGFEAQGFGTQPWDAFDSAYEDEVFILDGSTNIFQMSSPLIDGVEYHVYLNGVRIDGPNFDGSTIINNVRMSTIIGDGSTTVIVLNEQIVGITDGDNVIIRKATSDGSFTPSPDSYDIALSGGDLGYTTATGVLPESINIDGDDFVSPLSSQGPEELVPGQLIDTLDMRVFHKPSEGVGKIDVVHYTLDTSTTTFTLPGTPFSNSDIIVQLDGVILPSELYSINWFDNTLHIDGDSSYEIGGSNRVSITTIGANGTDLIDRNSLTYVTGISQIPTVAIWSTTVTAILTINGVIKTVGVDYNLVKSTTGKVVIELLNTASISNNNIIQYSLYNNTLKTYSQIITDKTFIPDGSTTTYSVNVTPFNNNPWSHKILLLVDNKVQKPGYSRTYTATSSRVYNIDSWQFTQPSQITSTDIQVFVDTVKLTSLQYTYNPAEYTITLTDDLIAPVGASINVVIDKDADYKVRSDIIEFTTAPAAGKKVELIHFSNHDVNKFERVALSVLTTSTTGEPSTIASLTSGTPEYIKRQEVTQGIIRLTNIVSNNRYVWVFKNGVMLDVNIDYIVNSKLNAVELTNIPVELDTIDVLQFGNSTTDSFGYRVFKDMLNRTHYKRLNEANSYKLQSILNYNDNTIQLQNATGIFEPDVSTNIPGVIFVEGERIEYFAKTGNNLTQLRRGTLGTGVKLAYAVDTKVYGQGPDENILYNDTIDKQTFSGNGSSATVDLNFTPTYGVNEIEIKVGGKRLRKSSISMYNESNDQDSTEGDETINPEFVISGNTVTFSTIPLDGERIEVYRKTGQIWNEIVSNSTTKSLGSSNNDISKFLLKATIQLPK